MKKIILLFIAAVVAIKGVAQNINPESDYVPGRSTAPQLAVPSDSLFTGWCIDANLTGGFLWQELTAKSQAANYTNALNTNISGLRFENGISRGIDVQVGYFFGCKRNFGIGAGLMYMYQQGDLVMNNFHIEYQSIDNFNNTFRQSITANHQVKESLSISNVNIPLVFKYRTTIYKRVGFSADAGLLFNVTIKNNYSTNARFDYEAIYKYTGTQGNIVPVYDNSPVPASGDLLITKSEYQGTVSSGNVQNYFNTLRNNGYNVGLGMRPVNTNGNVYYDAPSVGIILRPTVNIMLTENVSFNVGLYYIYQHFSNTAPAGYRITNKVGEYNSMLSSVTNSVNNSLGFNLGVRYSFCRKKHSEPPVVEEAPAEEAPVASPVAAEEEDDEPGQVSLSSPILFDLDKTDIKPVYYPVLEEAVNAHNENKKATIVIHGYTDNTGDRRYNKALSKLRAAAVKNYLHKKGVNKKALKTVGHGPDDPAASNSTSEGRAMNRRAVMELHTGR